MIHTIQRIQKLENAAYQRSRDQVEIQLLYETILQHCTDKEDFAAQSADMRE